MDPLTRSYVRSSDTDRLSAEMGTGAAVIAEVVPEVAERFSDLPEPPDLQSGQARFRLFDSLTAFLKRMAGARPSVLILEDLKSKQPP